MPREELYGAAIANMRRTVHMLAAKVPSPVKVPHKISFVYRYAEKNLLQAIVQKLARVVTTLTATHLLMEHGLVQEQAALQRVLQDLHEDVTFLCYAAIDGDETPLHRIYLDVFYQEEFDSESALSSTQKRPMVSRAKIQAYIANREGALSDPSTGIELTRTIQKVYSGYIHGASPQIMDMYGGRPPHFHVEGMLGTKRQTEHRLDLWNYCFRSILAFGFAAKAFADTGLSEEIYHFLLEFERKANKNYMPKKEA